MLQFNREARVLAIGEKIKILRKQKKLTLEDLAKAVNVAPQTIYKYEHGLIENIPLSRVKAIAKVLGTTPDYIVDWRQELERGNISLRKVRIKELIDEFAEDETTASIRKYLYLDEISVAAVNSYIEYEYTQTLKRRAAADKK